MYRVVIKYNYDMALFKWIKGVSRDKSLYDKDDRSNIWVHVLIQRGGQ